MSAEDTLKLSLEIAAKATGQADVDKLDHSIDEVVLSAGELNAVGEAGKIAAAGMEKAGAAGALAATQIKALDTASAGASAQFETMAGAGLKAAAGLDKAGAAATKAGAETEGMTLAAGSAASGLESLGLAGKASSGGMDTLAASIRLALADMRGMESGASKTAGSLETISVSGREAAASLRAISPAATSAMAGFELTADGAKLAAANLNAAGIAASKAAEELTLAGTAAGRAGADLSVAGTGGAAGEAGLNAAGASATKAAAALNEITIKAAATNAELANLGAGAASATGGLDKVAISAVEAAKDLGAMSGAATNATKDVSALGGAASASATELNAVAAKAIALAGELGAAGTAAKKIATELTTAGTAAATAAGELSSLGGAAGTAATEMRAIASTALTLGAELGAAGRAASASAAELTTLAANSLAAGRDVAALGASSATASVEVERLARASTDAGAQLVSLQATAGATQAAMARMTVEMTTLIGQMTRLGVAATDAAAGLNTAAASSRAVSAGMGGALLPIIGVGAALGISAKQAIDLEDGMSDVAKTTNLAGADLAALEERLKQMSTDTLPISAEKLAQIAAAGGQLGVANADIERFIELAAKMGVAFELSTEQAGDSVAKLKNNFNLTLKGVEELGDAINVLGNTSAARESDIVNVLTRIGGLATQFGLAANQSAALAATLLSLGKPAEAAGTAINSVLSTLQTAKVGSKDLQDGLRTLGLSAETLAQQITQNPQQALLDFLHVLERVDVKTRSEVLTQMFGKENQDDVAALVSGLKNYEAALASVADKEQTAGAMQAEFEKKLETTKSSLQLMSNALGVAAANLGEAFLPAVKKAAKGIADLSKGIADFAKDHDTLTGAAGDMGLVAAAAWLAHKGVSALVSVGKGIAGAFSAVAAGASSLGLAATATGAAAPLAAPALCRYSNKLTEAAGTGIIVGDMLRNLVEKLNGTADAYTRLATPEELAAARAARLAREKEQQAKATEEAKKKLEEAKAAQELENATTDVTLEKLSALKAKLDAANAALLQVNQSRLQGKATQEEETKAAQAATAALNLYTTALDKAAQNQELTALKAQGVVKGLEGELQGRIALLKQQAENTEASAKEALASGQLAKAQRLEKEAIEQAGAARLAAAQNSRALVAAREAEAQAARGLLDIAQRRAAADGKIDEAEQKAIIAASQDVAAKNAQTEAARAHLAEVGRIPESLAAATDAQALENDAVRAAFYAAVAAKAALEKLRAEKEAGRATAEQLAAAEDKAAAAIAGLKTASDIARAAMAGHAAEARKAQAENIKFVESLEFQMARSFAGFEQFAANYSGAWQSAYQSVKAFSDEAADAFIRLTDLTGRGSTGFHEINFLIDQSTLFMRQAQEQMDANAIAQKRLNDAISNGGDLQLAMREATNELNHSLSYQPKYWNELVAAANQHSVSVQNVIQNVRLLNDQKLSGLVAEIENAKRKIDSLNESARQQRIQSQISQAEDAGNKVRVENLQWQGQLGDLQARLDAAKKAGAKQAIEDLQAAIDIETQRHEKRLENLRAEEKAARQAAKAAQDEAEAAAADARQRRQEESAKQAEEKRQEADQGRPPIPASPVYSGSSASSPPAGQPVATVRHVIELGGGPARQIDVLAGASSDAFEGFLRELGRSQRVAS
jgi:TP901 family phage tail tape measure protein